MKKGVVEFLSDDLRPGETLSSSQSLILTERIAGFNVTHLWCKELLNPAGQKRFVQDAADRWPLPRVTLKQVRQQRAKFLGVVDGHGGVGASDDLQNQVLHVASLKLSIIHIQNMSGKLSKFLKKRRKKEIPHPKIYSEEMKGSRSLNIHYLYIFEYSLHA